MKGVNARRFSPRKVINQTVIEVSGRNLNVGNRAVLYFEGERNTARTCTNR